VIEQVSTICLLNYCQKNFKYSIEDQMTNVTKINAKNYNELLEILYDSRVSINWESEFR